MNLNYFFLALQMALLGFILTTLGHGWDLNSCHQACTTLWDLNSGALYQLSYRDRNIINY